MEESDLGSCMVVRMSATKNSSVYFTDAFVVNKAPSQTMMSLAFQF